MFFYGAAADEAINNNIFFLAEPVRSVDSLTVITVNNKISIDSYWENSAATFFVNRISTTMGYLKDLLL